MTGVSSAPGDEDALTTTRAQGFGDQGVGPNGRGSESPGPDATACQVAARQAADLFDLLVDLPSGQRQQLLDQRCVDSQVRREVEELLHFADHTQGFLQRPALATIEGLGVDGASLSAGCQIGSYRVVRRLGAGGMGAVYLAERDDRQFDQQVAIKVIHAALASDQLRSLFCQERQILANLDHPGIARLIDGGELADGRPYLVMEYVAGEPIDFHCRSRGLAPADRLRLFVEVCRTVQAAHGSLVIHQDLKPSNILVDSQGRPRLVDFGTARRQQTEPVADSNEERGPTFLTPAFCSPEQRSGKPVTTATDIYSLGLILERLAFDFDADPRPVVGTDDLRAIVGLATREQPHHRYGTVAALADDVERLLTHRPTLARPGSAGRRIALAARRHPWGAAAVASAVIAVTVFVITLGMERDRTQRALDRAERAGELLVDLFAVADPEQTAGRPMTPRRLLAQGEQMLTDPTLDGDLRLRVVNGLAKRHFKLGQYDEAHRLLQGVRDLADLGDSREAVESQALLGRAALRLGHWTEAGRHLEAVRGKLRSNDETARRLRARTLSDLMELRLREKDLIAAGHELELLRPVLEGGLNEMDPELGRLHSIFGCFYLDSGDLPTAEHHFGRALELAEARGGRQHPDVADALGDLALVYQRTQRIDLALQAGQEALDIQLLLLGYDHPQIAVGYHNLGSLYLGAGHLSKAIELLRHAVDRGDQLAAIDPMVPARSRRFLSLALALSGAPLEARRWAQSSMDFQRRAGNADLADEIRGRTMLAYALSLVPDTTEAWPRARRLYGEAVDHCWNAPQLQGVCAQAIGFYLHSLLSRGRIDDADQLWQRGQEHFSGQNVRLPIVSLSVAGLLLATSKPAAAEQHLAEIEPFLPADAEHPWRIEWRMMRSLVWLSQGDAQRARQEAELAVAQSRERVGDPSPITSRARLAQARALMSSGDPSAAGVLLQQAVRHLPTGADHTLDGGPSARLLLAQLEG